jgi:hypothetical protein
MAASAAEPEHDRAHWSREVFRPASWFERALAPDGS